TSNLLGVGNWTPNQGATQTRGDVGLTELTQHIEHRGSEYCALTPLVNGQLAKNPETRDETGEKSDSRKIMPYFSMTYVLLWRREWDSNPRKV
ncbi:hypothetical protein, partial [Xanthomonas oryzae]|uniref:hypothetical protein n=1 Tax=Xanthomonas oryzae TaxID=347 RepID=UPI001C52C5EB